MQLVTNKRQCQIEVPKIKRKIQSRVPNNSAVLKNKMKKQFSYEQEYEVQPELSKKFKSQTTEDSPNFFKVLSYEEDFYLDLNNIQREKSKDFLPSFIQTKHLYTEILRQKIVELRTQKLNEISINIEKNELDNVQGQGEVQDPIVHHEQIEEEKSIGEPQSSKSIIEARTDIDPLHQNESVNPQSVIILGNNLFGNISPKDPVDIKSPEIVIDSTNKPPAATTTSQIGLFPDFFKQQDKNQKIGSGLFVPSIFGKPVVEQSSPSILVKTQEPSIFSFFNNTQKTPTDSEKKQSIFGNLDIVKEIIVEPSKADLDSQKGSDTLTLNVPDNSLIPKMGLFQQVPSKVGLFSQVTQNTGLGLGLFSQIQNPGVGLFSLNNDASKKT